MQLGSVTTLLFRLFLIVAEPAVLLNTVDEELGQPPDGAVFQGLQNCYETCCRFRSRKVLQARNHEIGSFRTAWITSGGP